MTTARSRFGFTPRARTAPLVTAEAVAPDAEPSSVTMHLYDPIDSWGAPWGVSAKEFTGALAGIEADEIRLHINSPGGEVYDAIAIMNALRAHPARVVAVVDGIAASSASFIASAADELVMAKNSELFIHEAWGLAVGNAADLASEAGRLDKISANIASIYADKAPDVDWRAAMRAETWLSDQEAVDCGLADRVEGVASDTAKARHDVTVFASSSPRRHPPADLQHPHDAHASPRSSAPAGEPNRPAAMASGGTTQEGSPAVSFTPEQITTLRNAVGVADDADEATVVAAVQEALAEQAESTAQETATPAAPTVPEGMVVVDQETLNLLRQDAAAGREARNAQIAAERDGIVRAAINDGRIPPSRRDHWRAQLDADPGAAEVLKSLEPGLAVNLGEVGSVGAAETVTTENAAEAAFNRLFGATTKEA